MSFDMIRPMRPTGSMYENQCYVTRVTCEQEKCWPGQLPRFDLRNRLRSPPRAIHSPEIAPPSPGIGSENLSGSLIQLEAAQRSKSGTANRVVETKSAAAAAIAQTRFFAERIFTLISTLPIIHGYIFNAPMSAEACSCLQTACSSWPALQGRAAI